MAGCEADGFSDGDEKRRFVVFDETGRDAELFDALALHGIGWMFSWFDVATGRKP